MSQDIRNSVYFSGSSQDLTRMEAMPWIQILSRDYNSNKHAFNKKVSFEKYVFNVEILYNIADSAP